MFGEKNERKEEVGKKDHEMSVKNIKRKRLTFPKVMSKMCQKTPPKVNFLKKECQGEEETKKTNEILECFHKISNG